MTCMNDETAKIVLAGDWHGNTVWMKKTLQRISAAGYRTVIHVGDLRVLWPEAIDGPLTPDEAALIPGARYYDAFTVTLCRLLEELDMNMLFVDGNHDHHTALRALPLDRDGFGIISARLKYIPRGHRFTIGGVRFAGLGGAFSINRRFLTRGKAGGRRKSSPRATSTHSAPTPLMSLWPMMCRQVSTSGRHSYFLMP